MVFERVSDTRYNQSSLFTDFVPVTHKPISTVILGHWQRGKKKITLASLQKLFKQESAVKYLKCLKKKKKLEFCIQQNCSSKMNLK